MVQFLPSPVGDIQAAQPFVNRETSPDGSGKGIDLVLETSNASDALQHLEDDDHVEATFAALLPAADVAAPTPVDPPLPIEYSNDSSAFVLQGSSGNNPPLCGATDALLRGVSCLPWALWHCHLCWCYTVGFSQPMCDGSSPQR